MKKRKWLIIIGILVIALIGYLLFFRKTGIPVKEIKIKNVVVKKTVSAAGEVKSREQADLSFSAMGRLSDIAVEEGDVISDGAYIASLDNFTEAQSTQAVKDGRDVAKRDLELYVEQYETNMDAVGGQDEYAIGKRRYEELLSKAEATYQAQLGTLGKTYIYAPFAGKIIDIYYEAGETVISGSPVVKIADEDQKIFEIQLDQEDFTYLELGQEVDIKLDAFEDETFTGIVTKLPSYVEDNAGKDFVIKIDITGDNKNKALLGMTGDAYIILAKTDGEVPALTFDEVQYDIDDKPFVYVFNEGRVETLYIDLGLKGDIYTEIRSNIDKPIIQESDSKYDLQDGVKVKLIR